MLAALELREFRQEVQRAYDQRDELRASPLLMKQRTGRRRGYWQRVDARL